jgi:hypothetical protein
LVCWRGLKSPLIPWRAFGLKKIRVAALLAFFHSSLRHRKHMVNLVIAAILSKITGRLLCYLFYILSEKCFKMKSFADFLW